MNISISRHIITVAAAVVSISLLAAPASASTESDNAFVLRLAERLTSNPDAVLPAFEYITLRNSLDTDEQRRLLDSKYLPFACGTVYPPDTPNLTVVRQYMNCIMRFGTLNMDGSITLTDPRAPHG